MTHIVGHFLGPVESGDRDAKTHREILRYAFAVALTLVAFAATAGLKERWAAPSFMFFVPAVAIAAWYGGRGPTLLASALSLFLIDYYFLPPVGSLKVIGAQAVLDVFAFLILTVTIAATTEALRRARRVSESRAEELGRVAARASKLLDVSVALSEAPSMQEVAAVLMGKGLQAVEAARGVLAYVQGDHVEMISAPGDDSELAAIDGALSREGAIPAVDALRAGTVIWLASPAEYERRYPQAFERFGTVSPTEMQLAMPLVHLGETVGGLSFSFEGTSAFGMADRAFTMLLAQATGAALHRASSYDAERQKRRQAELLARAREDVLGIVAHDLRNPLNVIGGAMQLVRHEQLSDSDRERLLDSASHAAAQMNTMIGDLLDTVRLQAGRLALDLDDVRVAEILDQADGAFRPLADARHVLLEIPRPDGDMVVHADLFRVSQVLANLLGNALKFVPERGTVSLNVSRDDSHVHFCVADSGPGIPPSALPHLFEDFWQARTNDHRGVGLGLAIVKGLVEAQGGTVGVTSTLGIGSTFSFSLPVATVSPSPADDAANPLAHEESLGGVAAAAGARLD